MLMLNTSGMKAKVNVLLVKIWVHNLSMVLIQLLIVKFINLLLVLKTYYTYVKDLVQNNHTLLVQIKSIIMNVMFVKDLPEVNQSLNQFSVLVLRFHRLSKILTTLNNVIQIVVKLSIILDLFSMLLLLDKLNGLLVLIVMMDGLLTLKDNVKKKLEPLVLPQFLLWLIVNIVM